MVRTGMRHDTREEWEQTLDVARERLARELAAGTALVIAATRVIGLHVEILYSFVVVFASFVFVDRRAIAIWVGVCGLALLAPLVWQVDVFDGVDRTLKVAAVDFPVFVVMAT